MTTSDRNTTPNEIGNNHFQKRHIIRNATNLPSSFRGSRVFPFQGDRNSSDGRRVLGGKIAAKPRRGAIRPDLAVRDPSGGSVRLVEHDDRRARRLFRWALDKSCPRLTVDG